MLSIEIFYGSPLPSLAKLEVKMIFFFQERILMYVCLTVIWLGQPRNLASWK